MKYILTAIITAIVTVAAFLWISVNHPEWLVKLQYDSDGFPRIKKRGDRFVLNGQNYVYDGTAWVKVDSAWFPLNPKSGDSFVVNGIGYTFNGSTWVLLNPPNSEEVERTQNTNGRFIDGIWVPFSTIDAINATSKQKGSKCVYHTKNLLSGNGVAYQVEWYTYHGIEVSKADCESHGAL